MDEQLRNLINRLRPEPSVEENRQLLTNRLASLDTEISGIENVVNENVSPLEEEVRILNSQIQSFRDSGDNQKRELLAEREEIIQGLERLQ